MRREFAYSTTPIHETAQQFVGISRHALSIVDPLNLADDDRAVRMRRLIRAVVFSWPVRSVEFLCWAWMCAWAGSLAFDHTLLDRYASATAIMASHMSQPAWAALTGAIALYEGFGLLCRARHTAHHRRTRKRACFLMALMFGALAGELAAGAASPSIYGLSANAILCLFAFARLDLLPDSDEASRGS